VQKKYLLGSLRLVRLSDRENGGTLVVEVCEGLMGEVSGEVNSLLLRGDLSVILRQAQKLWCLLLYVQQEE
jgi:hypothetical protein